MYVQCSRHTHSSTPRTVQRTRKKMTSPDRSVYHWSHQLHQAASENSTDSLHQLLKQGNSPNLHGGVQCWLRGASSSQSRTPLHYAAKEGHLDSIRLLLVYGADPNARDEDGYTPLHYVCQIYSPGVERCDGVLKCVETLIEFGADVRAETNSRCTPRDLAQRQNNSVCLEAMNIYCKPITILISL